MHTPFSFRWLAILLIALAAPALLPAGANTWIGSRPSTVALSSPALVASYLGDPDLVYSAQDSNVYRSIDGGRTWSRVASFDNIYGIFVHPTDASLFVGGSRSGSLGGIFKSIDSGITWNQTLADVFVDQFAAIAAHPSTIYATTGYVIFRSDDGGETWGQAFQPTAEDARRAQVIAALIIDPADETTLDVGGYDYVYPDYSPLAPFFRKSADAGETWTDLSAGLSERASVSAIVIDPAHPSTIFVGMDRNPASAVFSSDDGGASWSPATGRLPANIEISGLVMDPQDPLTLYAGTNLGVYRTRDAGASWHSLSQLLSGSAVGSLSLDSLVQDADGRTLRVGNGLGTFQLEIGAGALDVAAGVGRSHVLSWDRDIVTVQTLDDSGQESSTPGEGPPGSWLAAAIADGADGLSRVLWVNGDGRAALETVGAAGSQAVFRFAGPPHYSATDISMADATAHILWTDVNGAMFIAGVDPSGNVTLGPAYGPYGDWTAIALADSPDGSTWVLWRATDGRSSVSIHRDLAMDEVFRFPASPDWAAEDITVAADGRPRLLRVGADDHAEVSTIDALGNLKDAQTHSPGWRPRRIAAGPDGLTRLLFSDGGGGANVFLLNPDNTVHSQPTPTPTPNPNAPSIVGTWRGTASRSDGRSCSVKVEIEQQAGASQVAGRMEADCIFALFEAQLVEGSPWGLSGAAHFSDVADDYCSYRAYLSGFVEGSPVSRIAASTSEFTCATQPPLSGVTLELRKSYRTSADSIAWANASRQKESRRTRSRRRPPSHGSRSSGNRRRRSRWRRTELRDQPPPDHCAARPVNCQSSESVARLTL
jgi:photosystem II stability/assembly factor-like uncharacterized protein